MKFSIITATFNNEKTIADTLESLKNQSYKNFEHIVVDGGSTDKTLKIVDDYNISSKIIVGQDKGLYDALNKGISVATGDVIGFLHADDFFYDSEVLQNIFNAFAKNKVFAVYGDLIYVSFDKSKVLRYWKSQQFYSDLLKKGWMPPHPTLFLKRQVYEKYGFFDLSYSISADYEFILRVFSSGIHSYYLPKVITVMRWGGKSNSSLKNIFVKMKEDLRAIRSYKIGGFNVLLRKNFSKVGQFFKPSNFSIFLL